MEKGLLIVNTGDGKGKTTAALGMALRAAGHGLKVCFIQFIKGSESTGEVTALKRFAGEIDLHVLGRGFLRSSKNPEADQSAAVHAWRFARQMILSGRYQLVVLDELTYLFTYEMIDLQDALETLAGKPADLHVVVTGRGAPSLLLEAADMVTEMRAVKHPLKSGVKAQKGVEF